MSTVVVVAKTENSDKAQEKLKAIAEKVEKQLLDLQQQMRRSWVKLAIAIHIFHEKQLYHVLGYPDEKEYIKHVRISKGSWYEHLRVRRELSEFTDDKLEALANKGLTKENAKFLIMLNAKERYSDRWIEKALNLTAEEFQAQVERQREKYVEDFKERGEGTGCEAEERVNWKFRLYLSQKKFIEKAVEEMCKKANLDSDDVGRALELLVAEAINGKDIMAVMPIILKDLRAITDLYNSNLSLDEQYEKGKKLFAKAVETLNKAITG